MNKTDLIDEIASRADLSKSQAQNALEATLDAIQEQVAQGNKVSITGFGNFERRERAARTGRNPQTGEEMQVPASKAPAFKPGKSFKDAVNG
jgi:DNA-binding protein HU-beta